jgi:hypothetical protein
VNELLSELKEACRREPVRSDEASIERGESTSFRGVPAHAEEGTVALGLGEDVRIVFREQDVRGVTKDADRYRVEVSSEASVVLRVEKTVKARLEWECRCHGGVGGTQTILEERGGGPTLGLGTITSVCKLLCADVTIDTGQQSRVVHICIPVDCYTP